MEGEVGEVRGTRPGQGASVTVDKKSYEELETESKKIGKNCGKIKTAV